MSLIIKKFWKTIKPIFSNKNVTNESITLVKDENVISKNLNIAELFIKFFANIVSEQNLAIDKDLIENVDHIDDQCFKKHRKIQISSKHFNYFREIRQKHF